MISMVRVACALMVCGAVFGGSLFEQGMAELEQAGTLRAQAQQATEQGQPADTPLADAARHEEAAARLLAQAHREEALGAVELTAYGDFLLAHAPDLAIDVYAEVIALDASDAAGHLGRIRALLAVLPYREDALVPALRQAAAAVEAPGALGELRALWGDYYWRRGMFDLAEHEWREALTQNGEQRHARIGMVAVGLLNADVAVAAQGLRDLGQLAPAEQEIASRYLRDAQGAFVESGAVFADTAANHLAYASLLVSALEPGELGQAMLPLERAVLLDPDSYVAWNFLGGLRWQAGDKQGAREAYQRSLMVNPNQPYTQRLLDDLGQ